MREIINSLTRLVFPLREKPYFSLFHFIVRRTFFIQFANFLIAFSAKLINPGKTFNNGRKRKRGTFELLGGLKSQLGSQKNPSDKDEEEEDDEEYYFAT